MTRRKEVQHYLMTLPITTKYNLHGYVMTTNEQDMLKVAYTMEKELDRIKVGSPDGKSLGDYFRLLPIILQTRLSTGIKRVQEIISSQSEESKEGIKTATTFHMSIFLMIADCPEDKELMALH